MSDFLDDLEDYELTEKVKPFYKVYKANNEKELLSWLNKVKDALQQSSKTRTVTQRRNLTAYRGLSLNRYDRRRNQKYYKKR